MKGRWTERSNQPSVLTDRRATSWNCLIKGRQTWLRQNHQPVLEGSQAGRRNQVSVLTNGMKTYWNEGETF